MSVINGYTTLASMKTRLGITDSIDDADLEDDINAASRSIDDHCQRHFWQVTEARYFDACDWRLLDLGVFNDMAVIPTEVAVDTDGNGTFDTVWASSDWQALPINATAAPERKPFRKLKAINRTWPLPAASGREGLIRVTTTWGWPGTPPDNIPYGVHEASEILTAKLFKRRNSPEGVTGWGSEFGPIRVSVRDDPDAERLLAPKIHPAAVLVA